MAITDYIPNIFGQAAPSYLQGLLGAEETQNLQNRANVQGLLGAGLALAQGMSRTGPRRSAAENILGALSGGFGAAGGAYEQGVKNYVTQQQIAQTQLQQNLAANRLRAIQQASKDNPQLTQLFAINPEEASKLLIAQERAKRYQSLLGEVPTQVSSQTVPITGQANAVSAVNVNQPMPSNAVVNTVIQQPNASNTTMPATVGQAQPNVQLVDPAVVQRANALRNAARQATIDGDTATATLFNNEANRIDPPEQITFRDGMAFSSKRGILGRFTETIRLTKEQAEAEGLPTGQGQIWQKSPDNKISQVEGTGVAKRLTPEEAKAEGLPTDQGQVWQRSADNKISAVEGTNIGTQLNKKQLIDSLPSQGENIYPTLKPRFKALEKRANGLTADQINSELQAILSEDAKIRQELDPTLFQQDIKRKTAGAPKNYINLNDPAKQAQALSENSGRYIANKNVSESFEVANRYNNFVSAYNNPAARGASDAFLIYSVAKILDPGGAVQQGDIETIAGRKSIPEQLRGIHEKFLSTRTLSDEQRQDLNTLAYSAMTNKRNSLKPTIKQYRNYAASFQSPDPTIDIQDPFVDIKLPKDRIVTINGKRTTIRLGADPNGVQGYYYTAPNGKTYPYQD